VLEPGPASNTTLAIVEAVVHDDLGTEDMPVRHLVDVQMMAIVDGKERSQARTKPLLVRASRVHAQAADAAQGPS